METGKYTTPEGLIVTVEQVDEENKMVYVHVMSGQYKWYSEWEYSLWKKEGIDGFSGTITHTQGEFEIKEEKPKKATKKTK